jgi:hydrogenase maturation protease
VRTVILGIGNLLRSDDGVGLHVIEKLGGENLGAGVDVNEASSGLDMLDAIKGYDRLILVDAIKTGGEPGSIYQLSKEEFGNVPTVHSFSTHLNMDFFSMLELGGKLFPGEMPEDITVVAIEAEDVMTISDKCTPKVERVIAEVVDLIKRLLS